MFVDTMHVQDKCYAKLLHFQFNVIEVFPCSEKLHYAAGKKDLRSSHKRLHMHSYAYKTTVPMTLCKLYHNFNYNYALQS